MTNNFEGKSADAVWLKIYKRFRTFEFQDIPSRLGNTKELLHAQISIKDPRQRYIINRYLPINPAFAIAEVVWILNGNNDSKFLNYWNKQLPKFAGYGKKYHGSYGYRLKRHFNFDQLDRAYKILKKNKHSRQVILQIWDPKIDLPKSNGLPRNADIPCNVMSLLKIREDKLEWMQIIRSNDFMLGLPYNLIQFTTLQEIMAGWLNVPLGSYNQLSDSLHVYDTMYDKLKISKLTKVNANLDSLALPKKDSEEIFKEFEKKIRLFITENLTENNHMKITKWQNAPQSYQNLLCIVSAEAARRREWISLSREIMLSCNNPVLCKVWSLWLRRVSKL